MEGWNKSEKTLLIAGVLCIALILVGITLWLFVWPPIERSVTKAQNEMRVAAEKDANTLLAPTGSDLKIVGSWSYRTGATHALVIYRFDSDGDALWYYGDSVFGTDSGRTGKWGRVKGTGELVFREGEGSFTADKPLKYDASLDELTINNRQKMDRE
jgi:hypothetical protein